MIQNERYIVKRSAVIDSNHLPEAIAGAINKKIMRWYIAQITQDDLVIEATTCDQNLDLPDEGDKRQHYPGKQVVLNVIPTGIGCSIGGYAGDAAPVTHLLAAASDYLITNPNAVNASNFIGLGDSNVIYTDGRCIDVFCKGCADLYIPYSNRIGLVIEKCSDRQLNMIFNIVNSVRAVHGVNITDYYITNKSIGGRCVRNKSGAFVGTIDNPDVLLAACEHLIKKGVTAIAVTTNIQDLPLDSYAKHFDGKCPNPVGGVEAVISYLITSVFKLPAAHAPLMNAKQLDLKDDIVDARGAGEMASESGLACILTGLRRAPQISPNPNCRIMDIININNLLAVVYPADSLGGVPTVYAQKYKIPIIAVRENQSILEVAKSNMAFDNVIEVHNYAEAAGVVLALKHGICLESISRPLATLRYR